MKSKMNISFLIVFLGILQVFISAKFMCILGLCVLIWSIIKQKGKIYLKKNYTIFILFAIFLIGLFSGVHNFGTRAFTRDIFYFINPIIYILIGINFVNSKKDYYCVLNSIVVISIFLTLLSFFQFGLDFVKGQLSYSTRYYFDSSIWGSVFSVGILLSKNFEEDETFKKYKIFYIFILVMGVIFGMSRTAWIELAIMVIFFIMMDKNLIKKMLKIFLYTFGLILIIIVISKIFPTQIIDNTLYKLSNSFNEISTETTWSSSEIQKNWRGFEMYRVKQQFNHSPTIKKIIGGGFGTGIDVGIYASFVHQEGNYIYVVHNGFYGMLIKEGIIGFLLYVAFYLYLLKIAIQTGIKEKQKENLVLIPTILCFIVYSYLVKGIFADFVLYNGLLLIGASIKCFYSKKENDEYEI